jgi:RecG-like helicase
MFDSCVFPKAVLCEQGVRVARERGQMPIPVFPIVKRASEARFPYKIRVGNPQSFQDLKPHKGENKPVATLENKVSSVIGDRTAKVLETGFGVKNIGDLMRHYPRRYMVRGELSDISALREGDETTILAQIYSATNRPMRGRKGSMLEVVVTDGTDKLSLTFFNQAWREKDLKVGRQGLFAGKVGVFNNKKQLTHPDYELIPDGSDVDTAVEGFA